MKKQMFRVYLMLMAAFFAVNTIAQENVEKPLLEIMNDKEVNDKKEIEKTLKKYLKAGDENDVKTLEKVTHKNFRVVLNDTKETAIKIVDRDTYLDLISKEVFGGTPRKVEIQLLDVFGNINAMVKTKLTSEKAIFYNYYSLLKIEGKWWVVQDLLYVEGM